MARVTVEDCIEKVTNRFELVMLAANRARALSSGAPLTVDRDNDKNPVIALREIADETLNLDDIQESLVKGLQKHVESDELEEEDLEMLSAADAYTGELVAPEGGIPAAQAAEGVEEGGDVNLDAESEGPDFSNQDINEEDE